ncbi:MAG TPA: YkgJ family cysteine cluster protein [Nitrospira sp.]|nr:YkgJ family cysteine cluster protein [Nitrospira sp.]
MKTNVLGTFPFPSTLFEKTARWFERVNASLLESLPCTQGCSDCCVGLFPVTILDRWEIQRGLRSLADEHRKRIERTAAEQIAMLMIAAPQLRTNRFIDQWKEKDIDRVSEQFQTWPCPALEVDGTCGLYEFRPLVCRSMGVPQDDGVLVNGACAVQTAVPLIRPSKVFREEENHLAGMEAVEIEALRLQAGIMGEELFLPYAFIRDPDVGELESGLGQRRIPN